MPLFASSEHWEFPFCRILTVLESSTNIGTKMYQCEKWFLIILTNISSFTNKVKQISVSYLYFLIGELICSCYFGHLSTESLIFIDIYELFIYWEYYLFVIFFCIQFYTCALFYKFDCGIFWHTGFFLCSMQSNLSFPLYWLSLLL